MLNIKVNTLTYYFLLLSFFCGFIKETLIIFFIILFHEFGHVFFSLLFHYKISKIEIYPFGGETKYEHLLNSNSNIDLIIYFGGIFFQILLYFIIIILFNNNYLSINTFNYFLKYNQSILIFNLLPIIPLDGANILNSILNNFFSYKNAYYITALVSILAMIIFFFFNFFFNLNNYLIIILFIYKTVFYFRNYKFLYQRFLLERYLYDLKYKQINNLKNKNLDNLKKNHYYYFYEKNKWLSEKKILSEKFDKKRNF